MINKIRTGTIPQLNNIFDLIDVNWKITADNEWDFTKYFLDELWNQFKDKVLEEYINIKKSKNIKVFPKIKKYVRSKIFNHFGSIQKVIFKHMAYKNKIKQLFINEIIRGVGEFAKVVISNFNKKIYSKFDENDIIKRINPIKKCFWDLEKSDNTTWENIFEDECEQLWDSIINIMKLADLTKLKAIKQENWEKQLKQEAVNVYVDGSYNNSSGEAGFGGVIYSKTEIEGIKINGKVPDNEVCERLRSISGELWGVIKVLEEVKKLNIKDINLIYDFEGIKNHAYNIWYSSDRFIRDIYIPAINKMKSSMNINFVKISSHSGIAGNDLADTLAKKAVNINVKNGNKSREKYISENDLIWLKENYKIAFKVLTIGEMMLLNGNLNNLSPEELLFTLKIKLFAVKELLDNIWSITEFDDFDPIDIRYYDLYVE